MFFGVKITEKCNAYNIKSNKQFLNSEKESNIKRTFLIFFFFFFQNLPFFYSCHKRTFFLFNLKVKVHNMKKKILGTHPINSNIFFMVVSK